MVYGYFSSLCAVRDRVCPLSRVLTVGAKRSRCAYLLSLSIAFVLPDEEFITVGAKCFRYVEILFFCDVLEPQPQMLDRGERGSDEDVLQCPSF